MVQRNIEVSSNVWEELKKEAEKRNKNVREFIGELLLDYANKNKKEARGIKAIILAAGLSSRLMDLTEDKPKSNTPPLPKRSTRLETAPPVLL